MFSRRKRNKLTNVQSSVELWKTVGPNLNFAAAEAYKRLRTNLEFSQPNGSGCQIVGITSSVSGEGKSTTAINIAYTMAQTDKRVLLLECDLRIPTLAQRLRISAKPGVSNLLAGQCNGQKIIQKSGLHPRLWVATAGDIPPNPTELLGSEQMAATLKAMSEIFDVIIVDLPPVTVVSDAAIVSKYTSGMVLVVRQDYCDRDALNETLRQLRLAGSKILGFVLTDSDMQKKEYKRYGKSYGGYQKSASKNH